MAVRASNYISLLWWLRGEDAEASVGRLGLA